MEYFYIEQIKAGDTFRFTYFVDTYKDMAFSIAFRILNNTENAEEVVQDAFLKTYRSLHKFRQDAKFSTWLYKIVVNTALTKAKRNKAWANETALTDIGEIATGQVEEAYRNLARWDRQKIINQALDQLNIEDRLLLTLYYLNENSIEEITEITGVPRENIKMKLHRARKKMYLLLEKKLPDIQYIV